MTQPKRSNTWKLIVAIGAAVTVFLAAVVLAVVYYWGRTPAKPGPPVTVTACEHADGETRVAFAVKNTTTEERSYYLVFRILDAGGKELSRGDEYTGLLDPAEVGGDAITLKYAEGTGATCEYVGEK